LTNVIQKKYVLEKLIILQFFSRKMLFFVFKYVVMMKNGTTQEYPVFGEHLQYTAMTNRIGPNYNGTYSYSGTLKTATFTKISSVNDISYIKLTGISLWSRSSYGGNLASDIDLELYDAMK